MIDYESCLSPSAAAFRREIAVANPATQQVIGVGPIADADQIAQAAVARARAAQARWAAKPVSERLAVLRRFQKLLCDQKDLVAEVITREAGKPVAEALSTEVLVVLDGAKFLIDNAPEFLLPEPVPHANPIMKLKQGMLCSRAIRRDRHYQPVELSLQSAFRPDADCAGHG